MGKWGWKWLCSLTSVQHFKNQDSLIKSVQIPQKYFFYLRYFVLDIDNSSETGQIQLEG